MKIKMASYFLALILILAGFVVVRSLSFPYQEDRMLFLVAGSLVLTLGAIQMKRELASRTEDEAQLRAAARLERQRIIAAVGWMTGLFVSIYLLGFLIAGPLFIMLYSKLHGMGWGKAIVLAIIISSSTYSALQFGLKVQLYPGLIASLW